MKNFRSRNTLMIKLTMFGLIRRNFKYLSVSTFILYS